MWFGRTLKAARTWGTEAAVAKRSIAGVLHCCKSSAHIVKCFSIAGMGMSVSDLFSLPFTYTVCYM